MWQWKEVQEMSRSLGNLPMSQQERFKITPAVYLVLEKNEQILFSRRFNTGFEDGNYSFPAGHLEGNETAREAMVREAKEEIGITIDPSKLKMVHLMHRHCGDHERLDMFFTVEKWEGEIKNTEPHKCDDLSWFSKDDLPRNVIPYIGQFIDCYNQGVNYSEFGW